MITNKSIRRLGQMLALAGLGVWGIPAVVAAVGIEGAVRKPAVGQNPVKPGQPGKNIGQVPANQAKPAKPQLGKNGGPGGGQRGGLMNGAQMAGGAVNQGIGSVVSSLAHQGIHGTQLAAIIHQLHAQKHANKGHGQGQGQGHGHGKPPWAGGPGNGNGKHGAGGPMGGAAIAAAQGGGPKPGPANKPGAPLVGAAGGHGNGIWRPAGNVGGLPIKIGGQLGGNGVRPIGKAK